MNSTNFFHVHATAATSDLVVELQLLTYRFVVSEHALSDVNAAPPNKGKYLSVSTMSLFVHSLQIFRPKTNIVLLVLSQIKNNLESLSLVVKTQFSLSMEILETYKFVIKYTIFRKLSGIRPNAFNMMNNEQY